ncbi:MAG: MBL fold metallo-hydrolase [Clostridia bacterium]|nr:MBL fold metallo-hydrolase [Clostridia bacterium]MBR5767095.1 MBL fold metallo-hydrolase [Clostridia bacterium]
MKTTKTSDNRKRIILTAAAILFFAAAAVCVFLLGSVEFSGRADAPGDPDAQLSVMYFNAGRGDSALVTFPDGERMLIDAGTFDSGEMLRAYFDVYGIKNIKYLVLTHPHSDHFGGCGEIMKSVEFEKVFVSPAGYGDGAYERVIQALGERGCNVSSPSPGTFFSLGGARVVFLGPLDRYEDENDESLSLRITYGVTSFLFTGDTGEDAEKDLVKRYGSEGLRSDVLKLGHHGSATASSPEFLDAVRPSVAVASCERSSSYGFPAPAVLSQLEKFGTEVLATYDYDIGLKLVSDGQNIFQ